MVAATNDVIQLLADRTALAACRMHYSTTTSGATFSGTSGWVDLGAIDPASPAFDFNKNITDVMTGSPMTVKQRHINSMDGTMSAEIVDYNDNAFNVGIGTEIAPQYTYGATGQTTVLAASTPTRSVIEVTDGDGIAVGDWLAVELGSAAFTWQEVKQVIRVTPATLPATDAEIEFFGTLSEAPVPGADVKKVTRVDNIIGGNKLKDYQLRVVASFNDASTMVIHAPKGNFTAPINPNMGDGTSVVRIPVSFGVLGVATTVAGFTAPQVTLATHYAYYPAST